MWLISNGFANGSSIYYRDRRLSVFKSLGSKINPFDLLSEHLFPGYFMTPRLIALIALPICEFPPVIIFVTF